MTGAAPAGLALYGPPAVGKSTITARLAELDARFALFPVVKSGPGRTAGYTMVSADEFTERAAAGDFVFVWERYDSCYAVSASELARFAADGQVPVVHLGSVEAVQAVVAVAGLRWTVVQLWASRDVCRARARSRGTGDLAARLAAYDRTALLGPELAQLTLDTEKVDAAQAARAIQAAVFDRAGSAQGEH